MKLVRWGEPGAERAGLVDDSGTLRDLSGTVADWSWQTLTRETLAQVAALDTSSLPALPALPADTLLAHRYLVPAKSSAARSPMASMPPKRDSSRPRSPCSC